MIIQNAYNRKMTEYNRFGDLLEDSIKLDKSNITPLEHRLLIVNRGAKRRQRNNHAERLAKYKNN